MTAKLTADMSVAPEIARLAEAVLLVPAQPAARPQGPDIPGTAATQLTLGTLARHLRMIAAAPERWWGLVRFDPDRSVRITVEDHPSYEAWLVVLPPGDAGQPCDCDVVTMIAGEATEGRATGTEGRATGTEGRATGTEGSAASAVLRPGPMRVHGQRHWLRGRGAGYSVSLHARARRTRTHK